MMELCALLCIRPVFFLPTLYFSNTHIVPVFPFSVCFWPMHLFHHPFCAEHVCTYNVSSYWAMSHTWWLMLQSGNTMTAYTCQPQPGHCILLERERERGMYPQQHTVWDRFPEFSVCNPGVLFRKSMLLNRDFLNSAPGLSTENSSSEQVLSSTRIDSVLGIQMLQGYDAVY